MSDNKLKVFFITSNLVSEEQELKSPTAPLLDIITEVERKTINFKDEDFFVKLFSFNVNEERLRMKDKYNEGKTYNYEISLSASGKTFKANIDIKKNEHSFLYNLKFNNYKSNFISYFSKEYPPPKNIPLSNCEQLKIFKAAVTSKKFNQQRESLLSSLFNNSLELINLSDKNYKYDFDFYLELFRLICFKFGIIKVIDIFSIKRINNPKDKEALKEYSKLLNRFEENIFEVKLKSLETEEDKDKCREKFYTLFLYYKYNFEKENLEILLQNKKIRKYLINVLENNSIYFYNIKLPEDMFDEMINKTPIKFQQMKSIFDYIYLFEKVLLFINKHIEKIYNCCLGNKKGFKIKDPLRLSDLNIISKENDNYSNIYNEISSLIEFEKNNKTFVIFDEKFWENFVVPNEFNNLNNLILIDKCINKCKEADPNLNIDIYQNILKTVLDLISKRKIKNIEILNFIKDNKYFHDLNYSSTYYRPLEMFIGIDLESVNEEFYKLWNEVNMFGIYSFFGNKGQEMILDKITHMKDFYKLFKLFNFNEEKTPDFKTIGFLMPKFVRLIKTYTKESCPNFINDISLLIYGINKTTYDLNKFLKEKIQKNFDKEIVKEIYINIAKKYKDLSKDLSNCIINYFINDKNNMQLQDLIDLLKIIRDIKFLKKIFNKMDKLVIKEEELFNEMQDIDSFKLLDWIQKENLFEKNQEIKETIYVRDTYKIREKILENIKTGNIKYNTISPWYTKNIEIFKEKLGIILFHKEDDLKEFISCLNKYFLKVKIIIQKINKLNSILKVFYENKHENNIKFLNELEIKIKNGYLNEIGKEKTKNDIQKTSQILPDLEEKNNLKNSIFFMHFFNENKTNKRNQLKNDDEIFAQTKNDFEQLRLLFQKDWFHNIEESIIKICHGAIKSLKKEEVEKEIQFLKKYFKLENNEEEYIIEQISDQLIALSKKEKLFITLKGCINFIEETKVKQTNFIEDLRNYKENLSENITPEKIYLYGKELEKYGLNVLETKEEDEDYINILHSLLKRKGALEFAIKLTNEDCRNLQELCSETENTFITVAEINDMEKCSKFINNLIGDKNKTTDLKLITSFKEEIQKSKHLSIVFEQYANHSRQIQELYSQKVDKSQATLKKIKYILTNSDFIIEINNKNEIYFTFQGRFKNEKNEFQNITEEELIEARRRAMLTKKLGDEKSEEEKKIFLTNKTFAKKINEILKINNILKNIAEKGYSEDISLQVQIINSESIFISTKNKIRFKDYEECNKYFNEIYTDITKIQNSYYRNEKTKLIRYMYGRLFILLKNYFENNSIETIEPFLKYITNDLIESSESENSFQYKYDKNLGVGDNYKYKCLLENINNFLEQFLKIHSLSLESIYQQNIVHKKFNGEFKGLYTYLLEDDKTIQKGEEEHILNWYYFLTENAPMAQTVLLCNEETTSEEIIAFMHRAFLCEYNTVFMVGKLNLLTPDKRQILTGLINLLYIGHEKEMKSCLVFVYSDKNLTIVTYLERIKEKKKLEHKDKNKNEQHLFDEKVQIVFSDNAGMGKSEHIKQEVIKKNKNYIHFPFGGEFSRKDVIERLKNIKIKDKNYEEDLYDSKQTDLMKNFLFSFLITKLYGQNENIFYLSKNVEIKIEIPNGFIDFFYKFPILEMFQNKYKITIDNLDPLIVPKELDSNMQIACNYLKIFDEGKISDIDLYIKNISINIEEKDNINKVKKEYAQILSSRKCNELIHKYIDIENPTYYQINSFINVLSGQLKKFSINYSLTARDLIDNGIAMNDDSLKNIRKILIDGLIKNTQHFTKGAYNGLLNSKDKSYKVEIEQGIYDENKQEQIAINVLSLLDQEQEMISFSKIKPSLIFFHENEGQEFSIISTCDKNSEEYSNLLKLKKVPALIKQELNNLYLIEEKIDIPEKLNDYRNFTHNMFLKEIKEILNIENPILNKDKTPQTNEKKLKSIEEIVGEYVFTADNFIKMILILLRIRENIPTIMMGETGCGKTSLIRKLSELINNGESNMKILNIHAGIKDKEIVDFLKKRKNGEMKSILEEAEDLYLSEKIEKENKAKKGFKYFEKKLWIFLDEINTCNCMGLICELMTKHSC